MLSRPAANIMNRDARYKWASLVLFVLLIALVLVSFSSYGISWDEPIQHSYSELVLRFYTSFFTDYSATEYSVLKYYGGFFELLSKLMTLSLPLGLYETRHLANALFGILGIFGCWKLARSLSTPGSAFWSAALLALYPSYYGHMFINPKDIPFAALYVWSLYYLVQVINKFPGVSLKTVAKFGVTAGLTMAVRVGGFLLLCYLYLLMLVLVTHWLVYKSSEGSGWGVAKKALKISAWGTLIAYAVMLAFWPFAVIKPFLRPFRRWHGSRASGQNLLLWATSPRTCLRNCLSSHWSSLRSDCASELESCIRGDYRGSSRRRCRIAWLHFPSCFRWCTRSPHSRPCTTRCGTFCSWHHHCFACWASR
jgi:hypothetical protein